MIEVGKFMSLPTVGGKNPAPPGNVSNPLNNGINDKLPINWLAKFLPSTVCIININIKVNNKNANLPRHSYDFPVDVLFNSPDIEDQLQVVVAAAPVASCCRGDGG